MTEAKIPPLGTLRDRIALLRYDAAHDIAVPLATVWARVVMPTVVLRYRNDLKAGDFIKHRGRAYEITEAGDINGRGSYLRLVVSRAALKDRESSQ